LIKYLEYVHWNANEDISLNYFNILRKKYSTTSYRKKLFQIRKFLSYLGVAWAKNIQPPTELYYQPKRITINEIQGTLKYFDGHESFKKIKALIYLGISSGLRAHELYQLTKKDIDIDKGIVRINHDPRNGQTTKTKYSRISFIDNNAKQALKEYFSTINGLSQSTILFSERACQNTFENTIIRVKDLRKYFSQCWDRRGGPTSIKKILMGHSIKGDVDLQHYNYQSEEDLKAVYDKVMNSDSSSLT
jgi:integrase/recombinase XerD